VEVGQVTRPTYQLGVGEGRPMADPMPGRPTRRPPTAPSHQLLERLGEHRPVFKVDRIGNLVFAVCASNSREAAREFSR
jgi:hypothetical protein